MAERTPGGPPLCIAIIGAGLCGLAAAVSLRRQYHRVELMNKEIGAAISMQVNTMCVLEYFGYNKDNLQGVDFVGIINFSSTRGEVKEMINLKDLPDITGGRMGINCLRTDIHNELKHLAMDENGVGPPARLHLGQEVVLCDPVEGKLTMKNGEIHDADLIIGSDGIHRVTLPEQRLGVLGLHPCRHGNVINVVADHTDDRDQDKHAWSEIATVEEVVEQLKHFHPRYFNFFKLGEQPIIQWQLRALPLLPTWINGRTALLGDTVHTTLPTLGQGAAMVFEDAATIGCLIPMGTHREDIPARLEAYQSLRKPQGELVNRESLEQTTIPSKRAQELRTVIHRYDAVEITKKYFKDHFEGAT
ncbi:hypothetical protein DFH08DRAFT_815720 [Mycena albidolilacea]|uniref:FAD-binding domain-containing protein n=1 Tax=Mycena albidolilacea TaxID=1033008 RepID=A0AAD6ZMR3_9AGAR|nr:hypothetical protein DFH08DRAFT_815720 [Mycena albidolilacea]